MDVFHVRFGESCAVILLDVRVLTSYVAARKSQGGALATAFDVPPEARATLQGFWQCVKSLVIIMSDSKYLSRDLIVLDEGLG